MGTYVQQVPVKFKTYTVTTASPVYEDCQGFPYPITVTVIPSGSVQVFYSTTPNAAGNSGTATWISWPKGVVSVTTTDAVVSPIAALKFVATTANAVVEVNA